MNKFGDNETDMYVATITADEVVFAGGKVESKNLNNYYLVNDNDYYSSFWTMSPSYFGGSVEDTEYGYQVANYDGKIYKYMVDDGESYARPAIQLKSGVTISGGVGTKSNPYVIN